MTTPALAIDYIVGLPSAYGGDAKALTHEIARFALKTMLAGDTLAVYNAPRRKVIAYIEIPGGKGHQNPKTRLRQFAKPLKAVGNFLRTGEAQVQGGTPPVVNDLSLPAFLDEIATQAVGRKADEPPRIIIVGSPLYRDAREPAFDFTDGTSGYFPSDGHIEAAPDITPFGTKGKESFLAGMRIHFATSLEEDDWINSLHRHRTSRFWSLFVAAQGGSLATFTNDIGTAFARLTDERAESRHAHEFDNTADKVIMLRVRRNVETEVTDEETWLADSVDIARGAPRETIGRLKLGIRWDCRPCDIDLYARPGPQGTWLYYGTTQTPSGRFFKDFTGSPDAVNGLEIIEFAVPVDVRSVEAQVNFYSGNAPQQPSGVLRALYGGRIYEGRFQFQAARGNRGSNRNQAATSPYWVRFDLREIFNLPADQG